MTRSVLILLGLSAFCGLVSNTAAQAVKHLQVSEIRPLLVRAAEQGAAHGVLIGAGADYMRRKFAASTPIEIDVRVLHALAEPGCSRLEVTTRQRDVLERGDREDKTLTYQVNYCRDGRFPEKR